MHQDKGQEKFIIKNHSDKAITLKKGDKTKFTIVRFYCSFYLLEDHLEESLRDISYKEEKLFLGIH